MPHVYKEAISTPLCYTQCWLESRYNIIECSCVVADLYCSSRLSCVVAAPQGCACRGCPSSLRLALWWLPWLLNLLSDCSLISQLARLAELQCTCMYNIIVLNNVQCTGEVQCTKDQFKA